MRVGSSARIIGLEGNEYANLQSIHHVSEQISASPNTYPEERLFMRLSRLFVNRIFCISRSGVLNNDIRELGAHILGALGYFYGDPPCDRTVDVGST